MKVNIAGKGLVPGVNQIAPVYNIDLTKDQILRIINFREFRVFGVYSGLITRANIDAAFDAEIAANKKKAAQESTEVKKPEPKKAKAAKKENIPSEPVKEPTFDPVIHQPIEIVPATDDVVEEAPVVVGVDLAQNSDVVVEPVEEETSVDVEEEALPEITEENVDEEKTAEPVKSKKKNKKNRN